VYAQTAKRDKWGQKRQAARPESEWIHVPTPALAIVTPDQWDAAHSRINAARAIYMKATNGHTFGRPALGNPSKYLLTNLASCRACCGPLAAQTRHHGHGRSRQRRRFYGCSAFRERGTCGNRRVLPMDDADAIVIEALLDDVLDESIVADAIDEALALLRGDVDEQATAGRFDRQLAHVEREHVQLMTAIHAGEQVVGLVEALRALDRRQRDLQASRDAIAAPQRLSARDSRHVRNELIDLAADWRHVLADDPGNARPIVSSLLIGRVTFTPLEQRDRWQVTGEGTIAGLFRRVFDVTAVGMASPTGTANSCTLVLTGIAA
jgi:site-specific DNA recombinase